MIKLILSGCLVLGSFLRTTAQYVQRWEDWAADLMLTNHSAYQLPEQRNIGLQLWLDKGFGMELHYRNGIYGTALYTRNINEAIWLGNYGSNQLQQQAFDPWMTLTGGTVGIGTTSPRSKMETVGAVRVSASAMGSSVIIDGTALPTSNAWSNVRLVAGGEGGSGYLKTHLDNWAGYFNWTRSSASGDVEVMRINASDGNVGIGTTEPQAKLAVNGDIFSKKVRVTQTGWPDYVFEPTYRLPTLNEIEQFVKINKHLPGVPSQKEVAENGLDLGENQAMLLKKIEELTLYIIELKKESEERFEKLERENARLKTKQNKIVSR